MMTLYYSPNACSRAAHIALEETGAPYERVRVSLKDGEQHRPEFLAVNPKGKVPALKVDGRVVTECPAVLAFIAASFPEAGLSPANDPFAAADMLAFNLYLASTVHVSFAHDRRAARWADDEAAQAAMRAKVPQNLIEQFGTIEERLGDGRTFVHGDSYSVSDPYLFTFTGWLRERGIADETRFPRVFAHYDRVKARPAVQRILEIENGVA